MKRLLMLGILCLVLIPATLAAEESAINAESPAETEVATKESVTEVAKVASPTPLHELGELHEVFGGPPLYTALAAVGQDDRGLCVICPLSYCRRQNYRCDYLNCDNQTCCTYRCYFDASCTQGNPNCSLWDCRCGLVISLP